MIRPQNKTHAVMSQRFEPLTSPDDFPTPPWATRALLRYIINDHTDINLQTCLEPACGRGYMSKVLQNSFSSVHSSDAYDYNYGSIQDYLEIFYEDKSFDWVITNPPFRLAEKFVIKSLDIARVGVAILARTVFIESVGRYKTLFEANPPAKFAQFTERVPMVKGRLDPKASTATGYAWIVWEHSRLNSPRLMWVPPCRRKLEKLGDYPTTPDPNTEENLIAVRQGNLILR